MATAAMAESDQNPWKSREFRKWIPHLQQALSCSPIRTVCHACGLISQGQKQSLMAVEDPAKHNELLLDMLSNGDAQSLHTFCEIVRKNEPEANFAGFLDEVQAVDGFIRVTPGCRKDCQRVTSLMKEFPSTERQKVVEAAEDLSRMLKSRIALNKRRKTIHLPKPTSAILVDLRSNEGVNSERLQALSAEIQHLESVAAVVNDIDMQQTDYEGLVTAPGSNISADVETEIRQNPCFVSIGAASANRDRSIPETKQYLQDTGFIDENTTVTEITAYRRVTVDVRVKMLAIRGGKQLKQFEGQSSSMVKLIIDVQYDNWVCDNSVYRVINNLRSLLGGTNITASTVHGESGGTAVLVQMSHQAHQKLYELCRDRPETLGALHILEVSTVDGAVVFNLRHPASDTNGLDLSVQEESDTDMPLDGPGLGQDGLFEAAADQPDRETSRKTAVRSYSPHSLSSDASVGTSGQAGYPQVAPATKAMGTSLPSSRGDSSTSIISNSSALSSALDKQAAQFAKASAPRHSQRPRTTAHDHDVKSASSSILAEDGPRSDGQQLTSAPGPARRYPETSATDGAALPTR
eukprot:scpid72157/ scgid0226/ 